MGSYTEKDGNVERVYTLENPNIVRHESEKSLIEIAVTTEFGFMLFCNGYLQFAEKDESIYHEMFVHPCLASSLSRKKICILGGGDGCALREVLKWKDVEHVDLIDWDEDILNLFKEKYSFYNNWSFDDPRVHVECKNVLDLLGEDRKYDCILVDLFDPEESQDDLWLCISKLIKSWLQPSGSAVINAGGVLPWQTDTINWFNQMMSAMPPWKSVLYKRFVPSFAREWCFLLFQRNPIQFSGLPDTLEYFDRDVWEQSCKWEKPYHLKIQGL